MKLIQFKGLQRLRLRGGCTRLEMSEADLRLVELDVRSPSPLNLDGLHNFLQLQVLRIAHADRTAPVVTGFKSIGALQNLRSLWLNVPRLTEQDIRHMHALRALVSLHVMMPVTRRTWVSFSSDAFLALLAAVGAQLQTLEIVDSGLSDACYEVVASLCPSLRELVFQPCAVTSLHKLALLNLRTLRIEGAVIADTGPLSNLVRLSKLRDLSLRYCPDITEQGLLQLRKLLGGLSVHWETSFPAGCPLGRCSAAIWAVLEYPLLAPPLVAPCVNVHRFRRLFNHKFEYPCKAPAWHPLSIKYRHR